MLLLFGTIFNMTIFNGLKIIIQINVKFIHVIYTIQVLDKRLNRLIIVKPNVKFKIFYKIKLTQYEYEHIRFSFLRNVNIIFA